MNAKTLTKNKRAYLISLLFLSLAIALPHAILTVVLLDKGIPLHQIMVVQAMFNIAVTIFEFPSSVWADLYNRKYLFILGNILQLVMFFLIIESSSFFWLGSAWFIFGLASALRSGTIDSSLINDIKQYDKDAYYPRISQLVKQSNQVNIIAEIAGSTLGSWMYFKIGIHLYWISILLVILSIINTIFFFRLSDLEVEPKQTSTTLKKHLTQVILELKDNSRLRILLLITAISQVFFKFIFNYGKVLC